MEALRIVYKISFDLVSIIFVVLLNILVPDEKYLLFPL